MSCIISIINQKGGTGKTTTAVNLAAGLAKQGCRVLLIDLDPQGHSTYGLGIDLDELDENAPTIERLFSDERAPVGDLLMETPEPNLKLLAADIRLARCAAMLHSRNFREMILKRALEPAREEFDYVIIDCQPTLDVLSINALVASNRVLIPTPLAGHALRGLSDLLATVQSVKEGEADFDWRILLTMVTGFGEERQLKASKILEPLHGRILKSRIKRTEAIEKSQMESEENSLEPVVLQKKWSRGARDYRSLVKEVLELWR
jgi:chromosome partitioning protein